MITITLYTKEACSLCHSLKADLLALQPKIGFVLLEQDVDQVRNNVDLEERSLMQRYRNLLPVLDIEHGPILYSPFSYDELFDAIDQAIMQSEQSTSNAE